MSELKQCSNCVLWTKPLNTSACCYLLDVADLNEFKINEEGYLYCDDFKSNLEHEGSK